MTRFGRIIRDRKDIDICFINPPSPFLINKQVFPPLGLMTLSSVFKQAGYHNIRFLDMLGETQFQNPEDIEADIFFIYCNTPSYEYVKDTIIQLRRYNRLSKFIVGGPHPSVAGEECLWANGIVMGEGEIASLKILREFPNIKKFYKEELIPNLDDVPFADRSILDIKEYANNYKLRGEPTTTYVTSRGCSYGKCSFCCHYWGDNKVRYRSAQNIYEEVKQVQEQFGISGAMFFDDEFCANRKRLLEFCKLIKPLDIKWRCLARVDSINEKIVPIMTDAGCCEIAIGIESAQQKILNAINKRISLQDAKKACDIIKDNDIDLKELFIIGLPGENSQNIQLIDDFVRKTNPEDVDFTILSVFPGSDIFINDKRYDISFNKRCKAWYKGIPGQYQNVCKVSTSKMTFEEIVAARDNLEAKYKSMEKLVKKE